MTATADMAAVLSTLKAEIDNCMVVDQHRLLRTWHAVRKQSHHKDFDEASLKKLREEISTSIACRQNRCSTIPSIEFDAALPVSEHRDEIAAAIQQYQVVIIAGETGSGKTTQLPKICLSIGRGTGGLIGHTQPRRLAARSVAARIAEELHSPLGEAVGYKVRFSDRTNKESYIKLMTDGILLAELQHDRYLNQYDTLIIDEAHERSLNIDFLLGYLKRLLPRRRDLKVIITSATLDTQRFSQHFHHAPVIEVSGRSYPVEIRYRPLGVDENEESDVVSGILAAVDELAEHDGLGDILTFLSGEREIREVAEALRKHHPQKTEILPLYSRLSTTEQNRIFQPSRGRRIVLATNVAETSLTVPGIRFVIDPGTARISRYSYRSKVQRLPVEKISQSSANQRAGRCGRVQAGICIRLYSEEDFAARPLYTEPEIRRTNLAAVILQMRELGLGNPEEFPFIDPPDKRFINDGFRLLQELSAIDDHRQLTVLGRKLARLPLDPRIGRMILAAEQMNCLDEILVIASMLSIQDPRDRPTEKQQQADEKHATYRHEDSDFLAMQNLWQAYQQQKHQLSKNQLRKFCQKNFLSFIRMREWEEVYRQIKTLIKGMGMQPNSQPAGYEQIHQALLPGLLGNIGVRADLPEDTKEAKKAARKPARYLGARNSEFYLFPGSGIAKRKPRWIVAAELVETTRLFARQNARIEPEWIEEAAQHLVKRQYSEPHWDRRRGIVFAFETVTLYGLVIVARRRVPYDEVNPEVSREIFLREGLVQNQVRLKAAFIRHNQRLLEEVHSIEDKIRRRDPYAEEEYLYHFFDQLVPASVCNVKTFERWRKKIEKHDPNILKLNKEGLLSASSAIRNADYPGELQFAGIVLPLSYCFDPGGSSDGVTARIPIGALNQLHPEVFEWLVPGFFEEKVTTLLKGLPKGLRKQIVPVPEYAHKMSRDLLQEDRKDASLLAAMSDWLRQHVGLLVTPSQWDVEKLPAHLQMRFEVVDLDNKVVAEGRDLALLQSQLAGTYQIETVTTEESTPWPNSGCVTWDFGDLPGHLDIERSGSRYRAYPALQDCDDSVGVVLHDSERAAKQSHSMGLRRLVELQLPKELKYVRRHLPNIDRMCLQYSQIDGCDELKVDLVAAIIDQAFFPSGYAVRNAEQFAQRIDQGKPVLLEITNSICGLVGEVLARFHAISRLPILASKLLPNAVRADIHKQLQGLIYPGFIIEIGNDWLPHIPRFLRAIELRLEKLEQSPTSDKEKLQRLTPYVEVYEKLKNEPRVNVATLQQFRWMLEEYRVSLFAQSLKTSIPISPKRLDAQIALCRQ